MKHFLPRLFAGCLALALSWAMAADGVTKNQLLIGQNITLQGGKNDYGMAVQDGIQAYLNLINSRGGVNGRQVVLKTLDDDNKSSQAEANARQRFKFIADRRHGLEEVGAFLERHVEHVGDRLVLERDLQRLAIVALALAFLARHVDVGQEVHLDFQNAVALAFFAAPALDVERKAARLIAARFGFRQARIPLAHRREGAGLRRGIGARRASDR